MRGDQLFGEYAPVEVLDVDRDVRIGGFEGWHQLVVEELLGALLPVGQPDLEGDGPTRGAGASDDGRGRRVGDGAARIAACLDGTLLGLSTGARRRLGG